MSVVPNSIERSVLLAGLALGLMACDPSCPRDADAIPIEDRASGRSVEATVRNALDRFLVATGRPICLNGIVVDGLGSSGYTPPGTVRLDRLDRTLWLDLLGERPPADALRRITWRGLCLAADAPSRRWSEGAPFADRADPRDAFLGTCQQGPATLTATIEGLCEPDGPARWLGTFYPRGGVPTRPMWPVVDTVSLPEHGGGVQVADGVVYAISNVYGETETVRAWTLAGELLFEDRGGDGLGRLVGGYDQVLVVNRGAVRALDRSGPLWSVALPELGTISSAAQTDDGWQVSADGSVWALSPESGEVSNRGPSEGLALSNVGTDVWVVAPEDDRGPRAVRARDGLVVELPPSAAPPVLLEEVILSWTTGPDGRSVGLVTTEVAPPHEVQVVDVCDPRFTFVSDAGRRLYTYTRIGDGSAFILEERDL